MTVIIEFFLNDHIKLLFFFFLNFIWAAWPPKGIILVWWGRYSACNNTCLRQWKVSDLWISNTDTHTHIHTVLFAIDPKYIKFKLPEYTHAFFLLTYKDCILTIKQGKNITLSCGKLWASTEGKEVWGLFVRLKKEILFHVECCICETSGIFKAKQLFSVWAPQRKDFF